MIPVIAAVSPRLVDRRVKILPAALVFIMIFLSGLAVGPVSFLPLALVPVIVICILGLDSGARILPVTLAPVTRALASRLCFGLFGRTIGLVLPIALIPVAQRLNGVSPWSLIRGCRLAFWLEFVCILPITLPVLLTLGTS